MDTQNNNNNNKPAKRFLSTVGAGVIGSVLTLAVVVNTDLIQAVSPESTTVTENATDYTVQKTANKTVNSLSDMVESASSAIVGIVTYQTPGNRFVQNAEAVQRGSGSGVVYKIDGDKAYIVTNNHVIEGAERLEVSLESGEKTEMKLWQSATRSVSISPVRLHKVL